MTGNEYQKLAMRTCGTPAERRDDRLRHAVLGLASEAGEVAGLLQKVYQGHPFDPERAKKELGDCLWMIAEACEALGFGMDEVMQQNIDKLRARYPDGFDAERSLQPRGGRRLSAGERKPPLAFRYARKHWKYFALLAAFAAVFLAVFWLYELPLEPVLYGGALCAAIGAAFVLIGFARFRARHARLAALAERFEPEHLPEPQDAIEADYHAILRALERREREAEKPPERGAARSGGLLHDVGAPDQDAHRRHAPAAANRRDARGARGRAVPHRAVRRDGAGLPALREPLRRPARQPLRPRRHRARLRAQVPQAVHPPEDRAALRAPARHGADRRQVAGVRHRAAARQRAEVHAAGLDHHRDGRPRRAGHRRHRHRHPRRGPAARV